MTYHIPSFPIPLSLISNVLEVEMFYFRPSVNGEELVEQYRFTYLSDNQYDLLASDGYRDP